MHLVEHIESNTNTGESASSHSESAVHGLLRRCMVALVEVLGGARAGRKASTRRMQVLETLPIGPKKQLLLVRCDGEKYLIGTGPESVQTILRVESAPRAVSTGIAASERGERH